MQQKLYKYFSFLQPNPQYTYSYQVSADDQQTYLAHEENRNGEDVTGKYSYVDPLGSLITVTYTSGIMGYTENRDVKENFVAIRSQPSSSGFASSAISSSGNEVFLIVLTER
jgi:hypothetical protein